MIRVSMKKKFLFPLLYLVSLLLAMGFQSEGFLMILTLPVGLLFVIVSSLFGIRITNIWIDLGVMLLFIFLFGHLTDIVLQKINDPFVNRDKE